MADAWGVEHGYHDAGGAWRPAPPETIAAIHDGMGAYGAGDPPSEVPARVLTVRLDHPLPPLPPGVVETEDGATLRVDGRLPSDVPIGYHQLQPDGADAVLSLIVSPGVCPAGPTRQWGWAAQLYATRSHASWGHGDLADLARLTTWSAGRGAGMALVNPLHAAAPGPGQQPSPYCPSSRCFLSPLYLRVEDLPGASGLDGLEDLASAGRALNSERLIDRDRVWALKSEACERIFDRFMECRVEGQGDLERFVTSGGPALQGFAAFNALAERHGAAWPAWPEELRRPDGAAVAAFTASAEGARRVRYHQWLQWHLDRQLQQAAQPLAVMTDLAIGVDAGGADAWLWQDCFALGVRVGAPPDRFNTAGQDWGVVPFDPWRLRAAAFEPFVRTLRAGLRHAGGLRVDHVMGLFRLWWIPEGAGPADGAYVGYPWGELLDILALESVRAGAVVVGEDLGTVEDFVREELGRRDVLSTAVMWFEDEPATFPERAVASVTTHDLPTVAGVWTGADLAVQTELGLEPDVGAQAALRSRLRQWVGLGDETGRVDGAGLGEEAGPQEVAVATYRLLATAPSAVLAGTLEDALGIPERPNLPGTVNERPNWSLALPAPLEEVLADPAVAAVADALSRRRP